MIGGVVRVVITAGSTLSLVSPASANPNLEDMHVRHNTAGPSSASIPSRSALKAKSAGWRRLRAGARAGGSGSRIGGHPW